jgi:pimeloyl-ACP methyl ester carboxylesterase
VSRGGLTARVEEWRDGGAFEQVHGRSIHVHVRDGEGPVLLFLHGFPSSSYDFRGLLPLLPGRPALTLDFLGFGLSDKPRGIGYTLALQADLVEELAARHFGGRDFFIVGHDMGTSVSTELMARDIEGAGRLPLLGALLFNGSIVVERASLRLSQKLLRSRFGPVFSRLASERFFRQQFGELFSPSHPLTDEEAADQWALICHGGGRTLGHETIAYIDERIRFADRWHGAIADWPRVLSLAWGMLDPVATPAVLAALRELRPGVPVEELPDLGHYPQLEAPERIAAALEAAVERVPGSKSI